MEKDLVKLVNDTQKMYGFDPIPDKLIESMKDFHRFLMEDLRFTEAEAGSILATVCWTTNNIIKTAVDEKYCGDD